MVEGDGGLAKVGGHGPTYPELGSRPRGSARIATPGDTGRSGRPGAGVSTHHQRDRSAAPGGQHGAAGTRAGVHHRASDRAFRVAVGPQRHHRGGQRTRLHLSGHGLQRPGRLRVPGPGRDPSGPVCGRGAAGLVHPGRVHLHPPGRQRCREPRGVATDPADPRLLPEPDARGRAVLRGPTARRRDGGGGGQHRGADDVGQDPVHLRQHDRRGQQHPGRRGACPAGRAGGGLGLGRRCWSGWPVRWSCSACISGTGCGGPRRSGYGHSPCAVAPGADRRADSLKGGRRGRPGRGR